MSIATQPTSLTITNPLVLYRTLIATKKLKPDPAQHRLALHLQKLYYRLKDYQPEVDFKHRLDQLTNLPGRGRSSEIKDGEENGPKKPWSIFKTIQVEREKTHAMALTRRLTDHESAINVNSPQGLLLYGEVGTGKSLLVDLLADSLPNKKKRRWHFNTFMLDTFARLEKLRKKRKLGIEGTGDEEHSLLLLARDMISTSPILFLDEFQLPDRAASKILSTLLTSFFHLGGVLVATSNRMPEELANASGIEFGAPPTSKLGLFGKRWSFFGRENQRITNGNTLSPKGDFGTFLDVLRARCEVWDMEGGKDWRRTEAQSHQATAYGQDIRNEPKVESFEGLEPMASGNAGLGYEQSTHIEDAAESSKIDKVIDPKHYLVMPVSTADEGATDEWLGRWKALELASVQPLPSKDLHSKEETIAWQTATVLVYGRKLNIPRQFAGVSKWTFSELCMTSLGPADYITLASTFHTFVLTDVPILSLLQKNEARRFITLLDAIYEARCKLLISAEAGPDDIFFPESSPSSSKIQKTSENLLESTDGIYPETFSEIYQDASAPFRPNISSYNSASASAPNYFPTTSSPSSSTRSILADEDSDFGPVYGAGRGRGRGDGMPGAGHETGHQHPGPDFTKTGAYTGEDERFAYKRARSRLWELCGKKWWDRHEDGWWKPLSRDLRPWEGDGANELVSSVRQPDTDDQLAETSLFRHGASPFRTSQDPPPKFSFVHAWGMMKWGKKAGAWGEGVDKWRKKETEEKVERDK